MAVTELQKISPRSVLSPRYKQQSPSEQSEGLCTQQQEYLQHLEAFLRLIEPIIEDLKAKGFIK